MLLSPRHFHLTANVVALLLSSFQFPNIAECAGCESWCALVPVPWTDDPKEHQKCDWKDCVCCPECPTKIYGCPESPDDPPFTLPSGESVKLYVADHGRLCTLTRNSIDGSSVKSISPVARSYDANPWESTAGDYAKLTISCEKFFCLLEIPPIDGDSTDVFQLTAFDVSDRGMGNSEMISRFLEQATFGATRDEINSWDAISPLEWTFPRWISDQMNQKSPTLHREYFRHRSNTRVLQTIDIGEPLHPCEKNSRWSIYAIHKKDERKLMHISQLTDNNGLTSYLFSIDGAPRTEVTNIEVSHGKTLSVPGVYQICSVNEWTSGQIKIKIGSLCVRLLIGNPLVYFSSTSGVVPTNIFSFDSKDNFVVLDPNKQGDEFLRTIPIDDPHCGLLHIDSIFPSFARFPKTNDWLLYDPRLVLQDNTPSNPIIDGGGSAELNGATCANVPKTFLNIDSCRLSNELSACSTSQSGQGTVICGSPGEISNNLTLGDRYDMARDRFINNDLTVADLHAQKKYVWTNIVLNAPDQLRQRMAWALSQILTMTPSAILEEMGTEIFLNYYDIFVRHAFGNYRDVLKEVSYSPLMSVMLSYHGSKSTWYNFETAGSILYPDENYAREIMQLFTIGTVKLAMDGTPIFDKETIVHTYDNDDIMTYARAWTGFAMQRRRGNIEDINNINNIDPMRIVSNWRDIFPKTNLFGGYVGDGYPLCEDLPSYSFLRKGAIYRLLGSSSKPELQEDTFTHSDTTLRLTLVPGQSQLYDELCRPTTPGGDDCRFQSQIVLDRDLSCGTNSVECTIDIPRVVQVNEHTFYEYVHIPCVELSFFNDAKKISAWAQQYAMCGNPKLPHASEACCSVGDDKAYRNCEFNGERLTYNTASMRCQDIGKECCHFKYINDRKSNVCNIGSWYYWNDAPCDISIKVDHEGQIAIVHEPEGIDQDDVISRVRRQSPSYFAVHWNNNTFPKLSNNCAIDGGAVCEVINDGCFCKTEVVEKRIFSRWADIPETVENLLSIVSVGSRPPDTFDENTFDPPLTRSGEIMVYHRVGESITSNTVFEVTVHGQKKYYRNVQSTVFVRGTPTTTLSFRNPPHFMSFVDRDERDAHYETDAVLDDYFHHSNTAPFLAIRFIQRFGISNPSPRFVKAVATAFVEGHYVWNGTQFEFGTGEYGDLGSTVAAILLDPESRSAVLDMDPTHGSLKEPLLKVIGLMRSMEFQRNLNMPEIRINRVGSSIGQMAHEIPTVFSFFLPEYAPPGPVSSASLVAPEAQLLQMPKVVGLLNGVFSMVKYGLTKCHNGWGYSKHVCESYGEGMYERSYGMLTFAPYGNEPHEVVNELGMLLTAGRLSTESRRIIESAYNSASDKDAGLRLAQQLILSTAEFHSTNMVEKSGEARDAAVENSSPTSPPPSSTDSSYKAIVFLLLVGGCDSYNMLVPHSNCQQQKNMYQEYVDVRGDIALSNVTENVIDASGSAQVCDNFFLHPNLPYLKTLYDQKDALFFANTGVLTEPVTKEDWKDKTLTELFAHNFMQKETQRVDPLSEVKGTGVLGRMTDVLTQKGYKTGSISIHDKNFVLIGTDGFSPRTSFISKDGITKFNEKPSTEDMSSTIKDLNNATTSTSGLFAETWSTALYTSIDQNEALSHMIDNAVINTNFPSTSLGKQLEVASRMIKTHGERGTQRDVFYVAMGGFDAHSHVEDSLVNHFRAINDAIESFALEMDHQNEWNNVVMLEASDFGRTLTSNNGDGSDHGWGGNYFMIGGDIDGGRILGTYPDDLTDSGPQSIKRGRLIPTTAWDEVWNGIGEWFGVTDAGDLDKVLPNREKFSGLMERDHLFVQSVTEPQRKNLRK